jgi:hypothetical protein
LVFVRDTLLDGVVFIASSGRIVRHSENGRALNEICAHLFGEERVDAGFEGQWIDNSSMADRDPTLTVDKERSEAFLSNGMDQQEADDKHRRAGYAMN